MSKSIYKKSSIIQSIHKRFINRFSTLNRETIAKTYLEGDGIEIGALNFPLKTSVKCNTKYVDIIDKKTQLSIFPELKETEIVDVDIIENGEHLKSFSSDSQDYIIANHFLEHCQNPIGTIERFLSVLKPNGVIFMAIPDKRYTFDLNREVTQIDHLVKDYRIGPEWSEDMHYRDFVKNTIWGTNCNSDEDITNVVNNLKAKKFSIHYHVWRHQDLIDFFIYLKNQLKFPFEIELAMSAKSGDNESIFILRKTK